MKIKKTVAGALAVGMMMGFNVFAAGDDTVQSDIMPISENDVAISLPVAQDTYYESFTGKVAEIVPFYNNEDGTESTDTFYVYVQNEDESLMNFVVNADTYMLTENALEVDATVTGYYLSGNVPMIMIYPPQVAAKALAVNYDGQQGIMVDRFDENLLNAKADAKLVIGDETVIVDVNGDVYDGSLDNKVLAVFSTVTMTSFPAQVVAEKIVVLADEPVIEQPEVETGLTAEEIEWLKENVPTFTYLVNGEEITAPAAYANDDGVVMLPIRAIAEALGYEVSWVHESKCVMLNNSISLWIGQDAYAIGKIAPIELGTAAELANGNTYVPMSFFKEILNMNNAYILENQIVVDNNEVME